MTGAPSPTVAAARKRALATLTAAWNERGIEPSLLVDEHATLLASDRRIGTLGLVSNHGEAPEDRLFDDAVTLGEPLGRGGMGEVLSAGQSALRREVALKRTFEGAAPGAEDSLLKEAWVGAHVAHPNVVPVHALVRSPGDGRPALLMQRVAGRSWIASLNPPDGEVARDAYLEREVGVLRRVCLAVAFAHSRGVLHLDLKPDNVMLGDHDEVYVLDWGLAAGYGDAAPDWLAPASDIQRIAGTPGYMAPELVAADGTCIGPTTDVYLLGAVLHHVLTGDALHRGDSMMEVLASAFLSEPHAYEEWVPEDLREIVARATNPNPSERFPDVGAFRSALEAFLARRPAERLLRGLRNGLADARARLAEQPDDPTIESALAGCELALDEATRAYPEHPRLLAYSRQVLDVRLVHAERSEDPRVVRAALDRAAMVEDQELRARARALALRLDFRERELRELEELAGELDASLGAAERVRVWRLLGVIWLVVCFVFGALERYGILEITYRLLLTQGAVMVAVFAPTAFALRHSVLANRVNRRLTGGLVYCGAAVELLFLGGHLVGIPVHSALTLTALFYAYVFLALGIALDRRFLPGAGSFLVAVAVATSAPTLVHEAIGAAGLVTVLLVTRGWAHYEKSPTGAPGAG